MLVIKRILKRKLLLLGLLALFISAEAQNSSYISNHKIIATLLGEHYGIPPAVILAVATVESSGGAGPAAKVLNNHFGIVGKNDIINRRGHKSRYKQYPHEFASYLDFCKMVSHKRYYARLKDNEDPKVWVKAISKSGYSEEPEQWEQKVFSVLSSNKL